MLDGTWHHVVVTYNGSESFFNGVDIYVDGLWEADLYGEGNMVGSGGGDSGSGGGDITNTDDAIIGGGGGSGGGDSGGTVYDGFSGGLAKVDVLTGALATRNQRSTTTERAARAAWGRRARGRLPS